MFKIIRKINENIFGKAIVIQIDKDFLKTREDILKEINEKVSQEVYSREIKIAIFDFIYGEGSYEQSYRVLNLLDREETSLAKLLYEYPKAKVHPNINGHYIIMKPTLDHLVDKLTEDLLDEIYSGEPK